MARVMTLKGFIKMLFPRSMQVRYTYLKYQGRLLRLSNPELYTDKMIWLQSFYNVHRKDLMQRCYDKYRAREYFSEKLDSNRYTPKLLGVYESAQEIPFESLPEKCILKVSQSSGSNLVLRERVEDLKRQQEIRNKFSFWLHEARKKKHIFEDYVYDGNAIILAEELLETADGKVPDDYRVFCFNGEPAFICHDIESTDEMGNKLHEYYRNTYMTTWEFISVDMGRKRKPEAIVEKPPMLDEMLMIAKKLSQDFPFVRVDTYVVKDKVYVGELTWLPQGGTGKIEPFEYEELYGNLLKLPELK